MRATTTLGVRAEPLQPKPNSSKADRAVRASPLCRILSSMSTSVPQSGENAFVRFLKRKWLAIVLVVLLIVVALQNAVGNDQATLFLLWAQLAMPTWALVLIVFAIGAIAGWVFARNRAARKNQR